jgi:GntR family transcriptional regulator
MTTRWATITAALRNEIHLGLVGINGELDTEAELCRRFATSRITIRRALAELKQEGLVTSQRGSGWTVQRNVSQTPHIHIAGSTGTAKELPPLVRSEITWRTLRPTAVFVDVLRRLGAPRPDGSWLRMSYLLRAGSIPFDLVEVWLAPPFATLVARLELANNYTAKVLSDHGVRFGIPVQAARADIANARDCAHLGIQAEAPVLVVERLMTDAEGSTVFVSVHRHPGHNVTIGIDLPTTVPGSHDRLHVTVN